MNLVVSFWSGQDVLSQFFCRSRQSFEIFISMFQFSLKVEDADVFDHVGDFVTPGCDLFVCGRGESQNC